MSKILMLAPMCSVIERFCGANFAALEALGHEVCICTNFETTEHDREYKALLENNGIKTYQLPFVRGSLRQNLKNIKQIKKILREGQFDLVHCHTETGGILTRLAKRADKNAKYIFTPHGMSFYEGSSLKSRIVYKTVEKWICGGMDGNIAINQGERAVLEKWNRKTAFYTGGIGLDLESVTAEESSGEDIKAELAIPADASVLLSVGELNDNKNHSVILKAIADMPNVYYVICGVGEKRDSLLALAEQLGMGERLILTGYRYDVKRFYFAADVFAFPSFHEGLPVSLCEAMAAGLPAVCSRIRGVTDLMENEALLFSPEDSEGFARGIKALLETRALWEQESQANKEKIKNFSISAVATELKNIYSEVL